MSKRSFFGSFFYVGEILVFGKHINKYYIKYGWMLLIGILALIVVDVGQLKVPEFYRLIINGMNMQYARGFDEYGPYATYSWMYAQDAVTLCFVWSGNDDDALRVISDIMYSITFN